ncbi:MAG: hypothetical protein ACFCU4_03080 [Puniceicoccaceae bacterium]
MASKKTNNSAWHIDYRFLDDLPDTKSLRTDVLLNLIFGTIVFLAVAIVVTREARINKVATELTDIRAREERVQPINAARAEENKVFSEVHAEALDYVRFLDRPFAVTDLIIEIMQRRPEDVKYDVIIYSEGDNVMRNATTRNYNIGLRGIVKELPTISRLKSEIVQYRLLAPFEVSISEQQPKSEPEGFRFAIDLSFSAKALHTAQSR